MKKKYLLQKNLSRSYKFFMVFFSSSELEISSISKPRYTEFTKTVQFLVFADFNMCTKLLRLVFNPYAPSQNPSSKSITPS